VRYLLSLLGNGRARLALAAAAGAGTVAAGAGLLATGAYLIVRADMHPPILDLTVAIVGVRFFGIARAALRYGERLAAHDAALHMTARLRTRAFTEVERLSPGGLETDRAAGLLTRLTDDLEDLQQAMVRSVIPVLVTIVTIAAAGTATGLLLPGAGVVLALSLAVTAGAAGIVSIRFGRLLARHLGPARALLAESVADIVEGAREAVAFGRADALLDAAEAADTQLRGLARRSALAAGIGNALVTTGAGVAVWLVLRVGISAAGSGVLDPVLLGALALLAMSAFEPVALLPAGLDHLETGVAAADRMDDLRSRRDPVPEPLSPAGPPEVAEVSLRGVWLRHRSGGPWALRGIDLDLCPGRKVALVGESGAGKSSVAAALLRFRDIASGSFTVGGTDVGLLSAEQVRNVIGSAGEDAHLLAATVRDNLLIADPAATDGDLDAALRVVHLDGWAASLPDGLDTRIGPAGRAVSGGERRRISLARAMLRGFPILIVDEPTAGLDAATARSVVNEILAVGRGVLLITHGTEGLDRMDEILVLDEGSVVERGTHSELLGAGGLYARFREARGGTPSAKTK